MKRGFTLIELLVVIAIIAILAAILFPVFARAREKARQSSCLSNIKQMSLAAMMYTQDYDEVYPGGLTGASGEMGPISQSSSFTTFWITADVIYPYVNNKQVFLCPSRLGSNPIKHNYGFNSRLCPDLRSYAVVAMSKVKAPAEIFMCLDSGPYMVDESEVETPSSWWYVPGTWDEARDPEADGYGSSAITGVAQTDYKTGRHNQGINIGFADGHAKWLSGQYVRGNLQHWQP
ncbi:MAG: DUF1559 domain-containing protein [candidate division WS1 bacterium]|jgi:prepilin-type N-terminal cleavage/methylation domain-containing protein/prepilin-type processing-associated H-X9-DG protein|nr:DUF1559 domain-containing protein [candidate division WS1 bacterium]